MHAAVHTACCRRARCVRRRLHTAERIERRLKRNNVVHQIGVGRRDLGNERRGGARLARRHDRSDLKESIK